MLVSKGAFTSSSLSIGLHVTSIILILLNFFQITFSLSLFSSKVVDDNYQKVPPGTLGRVVVRVKPYRPVGMFNCYKVSTSAFGDERPGFEALPGRCVVFLGKTLYSHSASLHPGV